MEFSAQQESGRGTVLRWWKRDHWTGNPDLLTFHGAAGTGKTSVLRDIAESLGATVRFAAYTGKAASVLRRKGCSTAETIHRLLYSPSDGSTAKLQSLIEKLEREGLSMKPEELAALRREIYHEELRAAQPNFALKPEALNGVDILIIDECSMIDERMEQDILTVARHSKTRIIAAGDPWQLQPVRGRQGLFNAKADVLLTEVHRQALDSGILQAATLVRNGFHLKLGKYGNDCEIVRQSRTSGGRNEELALAADQILIGRNKTRHATNDFVRFRRGILDSTMPVEGERVICLHNNHDIGALNGTMWQVEEVSERQGPRIHLGLNPLDGVGIPMGVWCHARIFERVDIPPKEKRKLEQFDFGYAITVHKAQGSEWPFVFLKQELGQWDPKAWLYTGLTRAAKRIAVSLM